MGCGGVLCPGPTQLQVSSEVVLSTTHPTHPPNRQTAQPQEEVAQRLVDGTPSRPDYRAMNLRVQYYSKPKYKCACMFF